MALRKEVQKSEQKDLSVKPAKTDAENVNTTQSTGCDE
jgi:hypothetical protein